MQQYDGRHLPIQESAHKEDTRRIKCNARNHFGSGDDGISFTGRNGTLIRVEILSDVDIESSSIATILLYVGE
jgi:hypothetical protein